MEQLTGEPGWNDPDTRSAWNHALAVLGVIAAAGLIGVVAATVLVVVSERSADDLRAHGVKVEATVLWDVTPSTPGRCVQQNVPVAFVLDGTRQETLVVEGCGDFAEGQTMTLFVDPDDPTRLVGTSGNQAPTAFVFLELAGYVGGGLAVVWGVVGYARLRRARSVLRKAAWTRRSARGYPLTLRWARDRDVLVLVDGPEPELYVLGWAPLVDGPARKGGEVEFAVLANGKGVVAEARTRTPRPVRRIRDGRVYRKALAAHAAAPRTPTAD